MRKKLLPAAAVLLSLTAFLILMLHSAARITVETSTAPQKPKLHILIDPGHGGEDGGAVSGGATEKEINLAISRDTADLLRFCGFDVQMTRCTDDALTDEGEDVRKRKYNDMKMRLDLYNKSPQNRIISIHQNKFTDSKSSGAQIFYSPNHKDSAAMAECIRFSVTSMLQPGNKRECKPAGKEIYLLKNSKNPAVLVECGFISNPGEREKLLTGEYQKQIALAVTTGFIDYYNTN